MLSAPLEQIFIRLRLVLRKLTTELDDMETKNRFELGRKLLKKKVRIMKYIEIIGNILNISLKFNKEK